MNSTREKTFAQFAQAFESALGLGGEKTSQFLDKLARQAGPILNRIEKNSFNLSRVQETLSRVYLKLLQDGDFSPTEIQMLFVQGKEIFSELVKPEQLMPHLLAFAHQYFFNPDWKGPIDEFGMDLKVVEAVKPLLEFFYDEYWRVDLSGIEHIPSKGGCMLVANHSGTLPYDGAMIGLGVNKEHPTRRSIRFLVEDFVYHSPFMGTFMSRIGGVRACPENATWLLKKGELVVVFPEGVKGLGKLYRDRYQLQRFGRGGFIRLAIKTGAPIIPTAVIGAEEIHPTIWKSSILAKSMGIPYLPVTPTFPWMGPLGLVPFPTKWEIIFGKPIVFGKYKPEDADDNLLIHKLSEQVRQTIQKMVNRALKKRKSIWFG